MKSASLSSGVAARRGAVTRGDGQRGGGRVELIPARRRALILEHLKQDGTAAIPDLADLVGASPSTVRRDLAHLQRRGALERTHGGAILAPSALATFEPDVGSAAEVAKAEKRAIGAAVAATLRAGQSVIFDSGTTVLEVARAIAAKPFRLTAVTNSLSIAETLAGVSEIDLIVTGGSLRKGSLTLTGRPGEDFLRTIHADICILGAHAIAGSLLTETSLDVAAMKRAMIAAARHAIVVADSTKFTAPCFCTICEVSELDEIVTDAGADAAEIAALRSLGVSVRLVPMPGGDGAPA